MGYPYSKIEGGIILSIILFFWGLGAYFKGVELPAFVLMGISALSFLVLWYQRYFKH
ncbi:MAG: hypothetical protein KA242_00720 [Chitinophagales bacterium]|jgi:hypothetical protein|nr:hypothetical protein [Chitinophagales bacterium]